MPNRFASSTNAAAESPPTSSRGANTPTVGKPSSWASCATALPSSAGEPTKRNTPVMLERGILENLVEPLVQNSLNPCRQALADAGMTARDIDVVILVGGQTRMPRIHNL